MGPPAAVVRVVLRAAVCADPTQQIGNEVLFGGTVGGTDDRRNEIDKLERALGYALFQRNHLKDDN